jgi:hypothetical protein
MKLAATCIAFLHLFFLSLAIAQQPWSIKFPMSLIAIDDKPYIAPGIAEPGNAVDIKAGTQLVHYKTEKSFTYSLDGEKPNVTLSGGKNFSGKWDLSKVSETGAGGPVIAAEGKFQGWYLDLSEEQIDIEYKGKKIKVKQFILVKEPQKVRNFTKFLVSK